MRNIAMWLGGFILLTTAAQAQTLFATLEGRCMTLMAQGQALDPAVCTDRLVNTVYANGKTAYVFTLAENPIDISVYTFIGDRKGQLYDGRTVVQPINTVNYVERNHTLHLDAIGACRVALQPEGLPSVLSCSADTEKGRFAGDFVSEGKVEIKRVP